MIAQYISSKYSSPLLYVKWRLWKKACFSNATVKEDVLIVLL